MTSEFLAGDILLFWPLQPTLLQSQIVGHQRRRGHAMEHASFTHAAIWAGMDHLLCDATPKLDVHVNSLEDCLKKRNTCLLVRRVPGISEVNREGIVRASVKHRGGKYSFKTLIREMWPQLIPMSAQADPNHGASPASLPSVVNVFRPSDSNPNRRGL